MATTTTTTCEIPGHPDTYGLGIRLAFYVQWFGLVVLTSCSAGIGAAAALELHFLHGLTTAAAAVGLAININNGLAPAEVLVVLVLACGALYFWVPVYVWRLATCCRQWWDPEPWNRVKLGPLLKMGLFLMGGALLCVQLWLWTTGVHARPPSSSPSTSADPPSSSSCHQYGFLFAPVRLDSAVLITFNIAVHLVMLAIGTWVFACWVGLFDECRWYRHRKKEKWRTTYGRIRTLRELRAISDMIVASVVTTAVELIISWNHISGVNSLDTAAQLIPLAISAAYLFRGFYLWLSEAASPSPDATDPYNTTGANTVASGSHWGGGDGRRQWTTRQQKRHSHRSSGGHRYDGHYMPEMTGAAPSVPYATYTQQYRPPTVAEAPRMDEV